MMAGRVNKGQSSSSNNVKRAFANRSSSRIDVGGCEIVVRVDR